MSGDLKGYPMQGVHTVYGLEPEVARVDRDIDIVERLRMGGPNAMEVVGQAADEIDRLRRTLEYIKGVAHANLTQPIPTDSEPRSVSERKHYEEDRVFVYADDDLMTRAEKIVHLMGVRGAVGGYAVNVFRLLQAYEKADQEAKAADQKAADDFNAAQIRDHASQ